MNKPLILVVEDDAPVRNLITMTLKAHDYKFITAQNGNNAIMEASSHNPDIVLLDLGLPDIDGVEVIERIRTWSDMPIILTACADDDDRHFRPRAYSLDDLNAVYIGESEIKQNDIGIVRGGFHYGVVAVLRRYKFIVVRL